MVFHPLYPALDKRAFLVWVRFKFVHKFHIGFQNCGAFFNVIIFHIFCLYRHLSHIVVKHRRQQSVNAVCIFNFGVFLVHFFQVFDCFKYLFLWHSHHNFLSFFQDFPVFSHLVF
ncbi:hypothetical protein 1013_scaffold47_00110 [Bacteriophage sp.]|nr:hypothetical protein 1013_scaffold47_00110 [Bacteriophage sp.]